MKRATLNPNLTLTLNPALDGGIKSRITITNRMCWRVLFGFLFCGLLSGISMAQTSAPPNPAAIMLAPQPNIDTTTPVEATAVFDPPVIQPGGVATYRVSFNALLDSVQWPEEVIAPTQLEMIPSARGQALTPTGAATLPRAAFNYRTRATNEGSFTVPRYLVYVYGKPVTVPAATLHVVADPAAPLASYKTLLLNAGKNNPFVGEAVTMRIVWPGSAMGVQPLNPVKLNGEGFMVEPGAVRQSVKIFPEFGTNWSSLVAEITMTPMTPGPTKISAQGFTAGLNAIGNISITGTITIAPAGTPTLLDSEPVTIQVRPLPREKELPGYTGGIGQFKLEPPQLSANVLRVGDPLTLTVNVRGEGNLSRLTAPKPPSAPGWRIFAGPNDPAPPQLIQARGFVTFSWTLIPTTEETKATPAIPFSYFNPEKAEYVDLSVPAVPVTVKAGVVPADIAALAQGTNTPASDAEKEPKLSGLATVPGRTMVTLVPTQRAPWFPVMQLVPAVFFVGLWWWDRRRRFYEAHPEIILRRRARKALRREWAAVRKAAAQGDTSRFAASAVNAMRAACAPHYPAEARALVSSDVVPLLDATNGNGAPNVVRRIFAAADAERFAGQPAGATDVLALRGELERVLAQLEAKL